MADTRVLLTSCDQALVLTVREVVECVQGCHLEVIQADAALSSTLPRRDFALILHHLTDGMQREHGEAKALALLKKPVAPLVVLADRHVAAQARRCLQLGAIDYLTRPIDLTRLRYLVDILTLKARYGFAATEAKATTAPSSPVSGDAFLCGSQSMVAMMSEVRRVADTDTTLLLSGETGTGKTRLARVIHDLSSRRKHPFVVVNCGALSESLIESEIFGHVRGAFTGADRDRVGKFEHAEQGTLFLDEIDALTPSLQAKLLRAVEDRVFEPVGSNRSVRLEARLIAASNQWLEEEVRAGRFRRDLFYRLNVVEFRLPPLRERRSAIRELALHFAAKACARNGQKATGISPSALQCLEEHDWPGNLRELRNAMDRAVALAQGREIECTDLPEPMRHNNNEIDLPTCYGSASKLRRAKSQAELTHITDALNKHDNNRSRAAAELGISRVTLYKKLHKYGLIGSSS